jgi:hypothetical protein
VADKLNLKVCPTTDTTEREGMKEREREREGEREKREREIQILLSTNGLHELYH